MLRSASVFTAFVLVTNPLATARSEAATEEVLYSFEGLNDGSVPTGPLLYSHGMLIGTTYAGGGTTCSGVGCGTVFQADLSGKETVIHAFKGGLDGAKPELGGVISVNGAVYGTTSVGGNFNEGTVFEISSAGTETVLHSFGRKGDGISPQATLVDVAGTLYGTTTSGGAANSGTVFKITPSGSEKIIHSFGAALDGRQPQAGLIKLGDELYGTTAEGGQNGLGTVFRITASGAEEVIHSFGGSGDGEIPWAPLTNVGGHLYGTTYGGGLNGDGIVFQITTAGVETVIYSFKGSLDGTFPFSGLTYFEGKLLGTTLYGGLDRCNNDGEGCGTVFQVTLAGAHEVLHYFQGGSDASYSIGNLINVGGVFYGVGETGGTQGAGAVFEVKP